MPQALGLVTSFSCSLCQSKNHVRRHKKNDILFAENQSLYDQISCLMTLLDTNKDSKQETKDPCSKCYIIGTGLSDRVIDLPLSTLSILSCADVVLYDSLSLPVGEICRVTPQNCVLECVGKRGDATSMKQSEIDALLMHHTASEEGKIIVRLKGGDPFLFGRSRTEIDTLRKSGTPYHVVPNLSSCVAGPHYAGIPLTDPILNAQSFAVFSGTNAAGVGIGLQSKGPKGIDWQKLDVDTLVFLMIGRLDKLDMLCQKLAESSPKWCNSTPCAVVRNAGRPSSQQVWRATLDTLVSKLKEDMGEATTTVSPAVLVVGPTAALDLLKQSD